jgi:3-mercaptopyruvate sulfurtransferase SseA
MLRLQGSKRASKHDDREAKRLEGKERGQKCKKARGAYVVDGRDPEAFAGVGEPIGHLHVR